MKLAWDSLPPEIQTGYDSGQIHKVVKKGTSTIIVHTRDTYSRDVWSKSGKSWMLLSSKSRK